MPNALAFLEGSPVQVWRQNALRISFALFGLALLAATWKLWTPQSEFPQVPLVAWAGYVPPALQWSTLALAIVSLFAVGFGQAGRSPYVVLAGSLTLLALIDQHRLQPWAFQFVIFAMVLAALPPARAFVLLRWLTVSIYLWSAVAKLDVTFVNTLGQQFLAALFGIVRLPVENWSPESHAAGAWVFPLSEIVIGLGLALPLDRFTLLRRIVLALVVAMHALLILALSPLGLNHQPAVMLWNSWFIVQAILLFGFPSARDQTTDTPESPTPPHWLHELSQVVVELLVAVVIALPVLNLADRYDHWLAWGLYAPRNSRALLYVDRDHSSSIDKKYQQYLDTNSNGDWVQWRLDAWSLDTLAVPIYPQDRFQLGVAEAAIDRAQLDGRFRIVLQSSADRWTGRRQEREISSLRELHDAQSQFFFNTRPHARPLEKRR